MNWIHKIGKYQRKEFCQTGETGLLEYIFSNIKTTNKYAVEFGAGDGVNLSNIKYFLNHGWTGLQMDYDNKGNNFVKKEFITKDNIIELFEKYQTPKEFDLLSIDLDGNDYWILENLLKKYTPRVIICEFNPSRDGNFAIVYNENHTWGDDNYYGATFGAFKKLMNQYGYDLVYNQFQLNLIFIKKEIIEKQEKPEVISNVSHYHKPHTGGKQWIEV